MYENNSSPNKPEKTFFQRHSVAPQSQGGRQTYKVALHGSPGKTVS